MATYREIKGLKVPYLDADLPSASASTEEGGVWYNSITGKLRAFVAFDTWATSAPISTARNVLAGGGIQTASFIAGGSTGSISALTEEYNGSAWTTIQSTPTILNDYGQWGTTTSAIATGGYTTTYIANTIAYNGSSWSDLPSSADAPSSQAYRCAVNGTSTSGLACGNGPVSLTATLEWTTASPLSVAQEGQVWYNTTSTVLKGFAAVGSGVWASGNAPSASRYGTGSAGTSTAGLQFAGYSNDTTAIALNTETYDGTTWTEVGDLGTQRYGITGCGTTTAGLVFGGQGPPPGMQDATESYNGTSWTSVNDDLLGRSSFGAAGTLTDGIAYGGEDPGWPTGVLTTTGYDGTNWSTRPSLTTQHHSGGYSGAGSTDNFFAGGGPSGGTPDNVTTTEEFSGDVAVETGSTIDFD